MKKELQRILWLIPNNPDLRERVHFIQDYDDVVARHLVRGSDIWLKGS